MAHSHNLAATGNTVNEVLAADVVAGEFAFSNSIVKFYALEGKTGQMVSPYVANTVCRFLKSNPNDTFALLADVFLDETAQTALTVGGDGKGGVCSEASAAGDTHVKVRINE